MSLSILIELYCTFYLGNVMDIRLTKIWDMNIITTCQIVPWCHSLWYCWRHFDRLQKCWAKWTKLGSSWCSLQYWNRS